MSSSPSLPSELEQAIRLALTDMLSDSAFAHHLAEEIADRLDGIDDKLFALLLDEAAKNSAPASEADIQEALKR